MTIETNPDTEIKVLTVSSGTPVVKLADALTSYIVSRTPFEIVSCGHYANNQLMKALAISRGKLLQKNEVITWFSFFRDITGIKDGKTITALVTKIVRS